MGSVQITKTIANKNNDSNKNKNNGNKRGAQLSIRLIVEWSLMANIVGLKSTDV